MGEPILIPIVEPVKVRANPNHGDLWFMRHPDPDLAHDFMRRDRIYVVTADGKICGHAPQGVMTWVDNKGLWVGALIHVYGDDTAVAGKDGPVEGDQLWLRWSGLPGFPVLETETPITYHHWLSQWVKPVLPGD
jgi:hypothetical protein